MSRSNSAPPPPARMTRTPSLDADVLSLLTRSATRWFAVLYAARSCSSEQPVRAWIAVRSSSPRTVAHESSTSSRKASAKSVNVAVAPPQQMASSRIR
eukprot:629757-Rhodomonas_salina.2